MKVGLRTIDDAILNLGSYKRAHSQFGDKDFVLSAMAKRDRSTLREISEYFYESSGIYYRLCRYLAFLYRYDWYIMPYREKKEDSKKIEKGFSNALMYLDKSQIKRVCGDIALEIMKCGVYYGIALDFGDYCAFQKLPPSYCRSRYSQGVDPIVELNLRFFDAYFPNPQYRAKILKLFPSDLIKAYILYKQGKLKGDLPGEKGYWYALEAGTAIKVTLSDDEFPPLAGVIPSIIDLDQAQDLDRKKTMQQLLKIIIQKLPLDKNSDLVFDVDEAKDIHNNAVAMLKRAVGVDVLTTFADVQVADMRDKNSATTTDDLEKVERTVYNNSGVSQNLFNASGNLAVTNSILVDEANLRDLKLQLENVFNKIVQKKYNRKGHWVFVFNMLETTQFNYKEIAKMYKENVQIGFSKLLPMIALGQSQSMILASIDFENDVLHLADSMIPPMSSATLSAGQQQAMRERSGNTNSNDNKSADGGSAGRPEKEDQDKSDKTLANQESAS